MGPFTRWGRRTASGSAAREQADGAGEDVELFDEAFQRKLESIALAARKLVAGSERAERKSRRAGHGLELADYRSYAPGDDYRHIDWNAYARTERLLLRLFEQEEDLAVSVLLDTSASMSTTLCGSDPRHGYVSKLTRGKQLAAALSYIALRGLDRVAIEALGAEVNRSLPAGRGKARIFGVLDFLRDLPAVGPTDLSAAAGRFVARQKRKGLVILISDLLDDHGVEPAIRKLRYARLETHVIQVRDARDDAPDLRGDIELVDIETGQARSVAITEAVLMRFRAARAAQDARIERFCRDVQVPLHRVTTHEPLEDAVLRVLRRGGLLT